MSLAGTYGQIPQVPQFTVDSTGVLTAASNSFVAECQVWQSGATYAKGDIVQGSDGNYYRSIANSNSNNDPTADANVNWQLFYVTANTTLSVVKATGTGRFKGGSGVQGAISFASSAVIAPSATVTISIGAGNGATDYVLSSALNITSISGARMSIVGAGSASTTLTFSSGTDGIYAANGVVLGNIGSIKLVGNSTAGTYGLHATNGGQIQCGSDVHIDSFDYGIYATVAAYISAQSVTITNPKTYGLLAFNGSTIYFDSGSVTGNSSTTDGVRADSGSFVEANHSSSTGFSNASGRGYTCLGHSFMGIISTSVSTWGTGYLARTGAGMYSGGTTTVTNCGIANSPAVSTITTTPGSAETALIQ